MTPPTRTAADLPVTWGGDPTLHDYASFLYRHRAIMLVALLVGLVAGPTYHFTQPARYTSTAHMVIVATTLSRTVEDQRDVSIDSALQVLRSDQVLVQAARSVDYPGGAAALNDDLTTRPIVNSRIVRVSVSALDPGAAQGAVTALVERFYAVRANGLRTVADGRASAVSAEIDVVEAEIARRYGLVDGEGAPDEAVDPGATQRMVTGIAPLVTLRAQLHSEKAALAISEPDPGYLSRPATEPLRAERSGFAITMSSAVTLSMLAAVGWCALHDLRARSRRDVLTTTGTGEEFDGSR